MGYFDTRHEIGKRKGGDIFRNLLDKRLRGKNTRKMGGKKSSSPHDIMHTLHTTLHINIVWLRIRGKTMGVPQETKGIKRLTEATSTHQVAATMTRHYTIYPPCWILCICVAWFCDQLVAFCRRNRDRHGYWLSWMSTLTKNVQCEGHKHAIININHSPLDTLHYLRNKHSRI